MICRSLLMGVQEDADIETAVILQESCDECESV